MFSLYFSSLILFERYTVCLGEPLEIGSFASLWLLNAVFLIDVYLVLCLLDWSSSLSRSSLIWSSFSVSMLCFRGEEFILSNWLICSMFALLFRRACICWYNWFGSSFCVFLGDSEDLAFSSSCNRLLNYRTSSVNSLICICCFNKSLGVTCCYEFLS